MLKEVPPANPGVARFYIDLLAVLKEKTEGRRTEGETVALEDILHQLRMRILDLEPAPGSLKVNP
jgi:hypothetical protein